MGKRELLFVTYGDEKVEEGSSYAMELARAMNEDITLLVVQKRKNPVSKVGKLKAAVTFAEAGEHDTARRIMDTSPETAKRAKSLLSNVSATCRKEGISVKIHESDQDVVSGIRSYLKDHAEIDRIVLSPEITEAGNVITKNLNRLVRTSSRPIVTMTRQTVAAP